MSDLSGSIHDTNLTVYGGADASTGSERLTRGERLNTSMHERLSDVAAILSRIAHMAGELRNDPDGHVRRSAAELGVAFATRGAIEPAFARLQQSIDVLRHNNPAASRRESERRAPGVDQLGDVIAQELLPDLRRLGFDL